MSNSCKGFRKHICELEGKTYEEETLTTSHPISWGDLTRVSVYRNELARLVQQRDISELIDAFSWRTTAQGADYWESRYKEEEPMSAIDWAYCDTLYQISEVAG